ncbi:MAG: rhodanese-related sulfurtransferase [Deferribacteres bacterium]|nr:rhodanese-related sulfurtransferase [candidate division KSB1 bacterium]MCB9509392.1 rhodanese-related sulfurtransferase [Deferribacteres bacterium]
MSEYIVCTFYHFTALDDPQTMREKLTDLMHEHAMKGTILLAHEGINGTVAGTRAAVDVLKDFLKADARFAGILFKESFDSEIPFKRTKVRLKKEIVTMGVPEIDPRQQVGTYVKPEAWNELISNPDVVLIDSRNDYEYEVGTFEKAINPLTRSFREFPDYVKKNLVAQKRTKVAMFCTGGIRCEKSTAYLKNLGFDEVYHLEGGILKYLEDIPPEESLWRGECFVFDERVTVDHDLKRGDYVLCRACRFPVSKADQQSDKFVHGISCPRCFDLTSDEEKARFAEREKQVELAEQRGEPHIGSDVALVQAQRRQEKMRRDQL